jgi:hypothetical protein
MKPLSTSIYTFSNLIDGGFLYVDKTPLIHQLLEPASAQYFLARPRRFGKSLLISTLKAIFQGRRELFKGLWLDSADFEWKTYPVIHLDMGSCVADTKKKLEEKLLRKLQYNAGENNIELTCTDAGSAFEELVQLLAKRDGKVVVLVDEYDKPLLGQLGTPGVREIQNLLKTFYGVIKTTEEHQRFALITGVSKFSKVSIFSDLNNLTDLTMNAQFATLLGYTQEELEENFPDTIDALAQKLKKTKEQALSELKNWYNGYCFHQDAPTVYNPVSVMKCFQELEFKNYWFETGTPRFLVDLLRDKPIDLAELSVQETAFSAYEPDALEPLPLLVQTGYLTLKGAEQLGQIRLYKLGFPNQEIEQSFSYWLAQGFSQVPSDEFSRVIVRLVKSLQEGRTDDMLETLKIFFAGIPYDITERKEKYYQTIFFTVFKLLGAAVETETRTATGRLDAVVKTPERIFIFEFKLGGTAKDALQQIKDKHYAAPYRDDGREIICVGVAFGLEERNLTDWLIEPATP